MRDSRSTLDGRISSDDANAGSSEARQLRWVCENQHTFAYYKGDVFRSIKTCPICGKPVEIVKVGA